MLHETSCVNLKLFSFYTTYSTNFIVNISEVSRIRDSMLEAYNLSNADPDPVSKINADPNQ